MKESKLFLNFFKENILLLVLPAMFFGVAGYFYQQSKPSTYKIGQLFEANYSILEVPAKVALMDEAVTLIRSSNLQAELGIKNAKVAVFKPGPLAIKIEAESQDREVLKSNLNKAEGYLVKNFDVKRVGIIDEQEIKPNLFLGGLAGLSAGFLLGFVVALTISYFKKF